MRRTPRNTPLWIVLGAGLVILAATSSTHARKESPVKSSAGNATVAKKPAPARADGEGPTHTRSPGESSQETPAADMVAAPLTPLDLSPPEPAPASTDPVGTAGMVVGIDPETGKIGKPSREFRDALLESDRNPALSRSMEGLQVIHRPDGSRMVDLRDRFQEYSVIRITPDGRKEQVCVEGPDVEAALQGRMTASPAEPTDGAPADDPEADVTSEEPVER